MAAIRPIPMHTLKERAYRLLRWSEKYTKTDMVYLARGGFWINMGSMSISLFSFFLYLAFARFLPTEVYGTYQYLLSLASIAGAFTLTGMNSALVRAVAQGQEGTVSASIPLQLKWGLLPLAGSWALAVYYYAHGNITLAAGLFLIGIFVPLNNAFNSYGAWITGRKDFRASFFFAFLGNLLYYPALIVAAYFSKLALVLLAVNLAVQSVTLGISYVVAKRRYQPNANVDRDAFTYGGHLSLMGVFAAVAAQIDNILAFHFLGASSLAVYNFATAVPDRVANLVKFVPSIALPKLALRTREEVRRTLLPRLAWALAGSSLIAAAYMAIARPFFAFFFPAYLDAVPYSVLYALIIIPTIGSVFTAALTAHRSVGALYVVNGVIPTLQLVLTAGGIILWGLWGLIVARIASYTLQFFVGAFFFFRHDVRP